MISTERLIKAGVWSAEVSLRMYIDAQPYQNYHHPERRTESLGALTVIIRFREKLKLP